MIFKQHQLLSLRLGKCIAELRDFHEDRTHPYWRWVNDIMDNLYCLQDSVNEDYNEDYRELERQKDEQK